MFEAKWTGTYPTLCFGEWVIKYNGKQLELPEDVKSRCMNTEGEYESWHFEDWVEVFDSYYDGLEEDDWIGVNKAWVDSLFEEHNISKTKDNYYELFKSVQAEDWRSGSCGGCI